jgi:uncharacterized membrane protein YdcZ (DUF606 family)
MNPYVTIVLLVAAGTALVVRNPLMVRTKAVSTVIITLVINFSTSLAGLVVRGAFLLACRSF